MCIVIIFLQVDDINNFENKLTFLIKPEAVSGTDIFLWILQNF